MKRLLSPLTINIFNLLSKTLILVLFFFNTSSSYATHSQGGEITMTCLGGNIYELKLTFYRDCSGVNAPSTASIKYQSVSCGINQTATLARAAGTGQEISSICATAPTACSGGSTPGVEEYIYSAVVTLTACNDWRIFYLIGSRNHAIGTIDTPGAQDLYIESSINNLDFPCSSSPIFSNKPTPNVCVGADYCFNNGAYDADSDSLSYAMVDPLIAPNSSVSYLPPYTATQPLASLTPMTFDPVTGDICMSPTQIQVTIFAVLVTKWRGGVKVGEILRDIQLRTIPCINTNPYLNGINNTGLYAMDAIAGNPISFDINTFDDDLGDSLAVTWNNAISGGIFNAGQGKNPTATFTWTPTLADVSATPHCFTATVKDDNCPYFGSETSSFCINVKAISTGIDNNRDLSSEVDIYPNPASNQLSIDTKLKVNEIIIFDITNKNIMSIKQNTSLVNVAELLPGIYFIKLITEEGIITKKFVKH